MRKCLPMLLLMTGMAAAQTTQTGTANLTPQNVNGVVYATMFSGSDIGAKINNAIANVSQCGKVIVPPGNYSFSTPIIKPRCVNIEGASAFSTILTWTPSSGISLTVQDSLNNVGPPVYTQGVVSNLTLLGPGHASSAVGVSIGDGNTTHWADRQSFNHVRIDSFGIGMTWGNNAWSTTVSESVITNNGTGIVYPNGLKNSGEAIVFSTTSIQNSSGVGMNLPGFADFYFYGDSCDFNASGCGIVNIAHFYGMHFESTHGTMLTEVSSSTNNIASVEIYGGMVALDASTGTDAQVFSVPSTVGPNSQFKIVGTYIDAAHTVTNLVNWAATGPNVVLDIEGIPYMGGHVLGVTNSTCLFQGCQIHDVKGFLALNGNGWQVQNNGNALLNTITSGKAGGGGAQMGFLSGQGYIAGNSKGLDIYPLGTSDTPFFVRHLAFNMNGFTMGNLGGLSIGGGGSAVSITNTNAVPQVGTPPVGQVACIKAAGPPVIIGYCSTVVSAGGACTCN
jgi:hypothetical protein